MRGSWALDILPPPLPTPFPFFALLFLFGFVANCVTVYTPCAAFGASSSSMEPNNSNPPTLPY